MIGIVKDALAEALNTFLTMSCSINALPDLERQKLRSYIDIILDEQEEQEHRTKCFHQSVDLLYSNLGDEDAGTEP